MHWKVHSSKMGYSVNLRARHGHGISSMRQYGTCHVCSQVTQLQLQASHDDLSHKVKEAELLQLGADSISKAEALQARSAAAERRTEELQIDIETLNQQFEWLQHQSQQQQAQAWQKEQLLQLHQQQLAAATATAANTQLARSEEQLVMKGR